MIIGKSDANVKYTFASLPIPALYECLGVRGCKIGELRAFIISGPQLGNVVDVGEAKADSLVTPIKLEPTTLEAETGPVVSPYENLECGQTWSYVGEQPEWVQSGDIFVKTGRNMCVRLRDGRRAFTNFPSFEKEPVQITSPLEVAGHFASLANAHVVVPKVPSSHVNYNDDGDLIVLTNSGWCVIQGDDVVPLVQQLSQVQANYEYMSDELQANQSVSSMSEPSPRELALPGVPYDTEHATDTNIEDRSKPVLGWKTREFSRNNGPCRWDLRCMSTSGKWDDGGYCDCATEEEAIAMSWQFEDEHNKHQAHMKAVSDEKQKQAVECLAAAFASYVRDNTDPDQLPEPWVDEAQSILGARAGEIYDAEQKRQEGGNPLHRWVVCA